MVAGRCRRAPGAGALIRGLGIDAVAVARIRAVLLRRGERFLASVLTADEPARLPAGARRAAERVAARWAAKEAALKALGTGRTGGLDLVQIEVVHDGAGAPGLVLHGPAALRQAALGATRCWLSLTHDRGIAAAVVVLEGT